MPEYDENDDRLDPASSYLLPRTVTDADMLRELLRNLLAAAGREGLTLGEAQRAVEANSESRVGTDRVLTWLRDEVDAGESRAPHRRSVDRHACLS